MANPRSVSKFRSEDETYNIRSCQWWRAEDKDKRPDQMLTPLLNQIRKDQRHRYEAYKHWARCMDQDMSAVDGTETSYLKYYGSELTINEAMNTLETLHAQIFKNKILPSMCPEEGDYEDEFQARGFNRWLEGVFDDAGVHDVVFPQSGFDCLWAGTGCIKGIGRPTGKKKSKVTFESVSPRHLFVDRIEARNGKPRSLHQMMFWDRWVAADRWAPKGDKEKAELRNKILEVKTTDKEDHDYDVADQGDGDQITLWESWHLPSGPESGDGKHVIWMDGATLFEEEWKYDRFPFTFMRFGLKVAGFWGVSALYRILPAQKAFDRITKQIDECHQVMGLPRIIVRKGSGLQQSHIDDLPFTILETESPAGDIKEWNPVPINPAMYQERDSLVRRMRGAIGVSDFEAQNQIPTNIRDGAAAYMDRAIEQGQARHAMLHKAYESAVLDLADLALLIATDELSKGRDVVVKAPGSEMRTTIEMLRFSDVKVKRESLKMRVLPVSQLPRTFSNRVKDLALLRDRGDLTQKTFLRLLEIPDIDAEIDNMVSSEDIIRRNLSFMLRTGKYLSPLPYDNHDLIVKLTADKIHEARCREVDENRVALLVKYIDDAINLKAGIGPAPQPQGAMGPMAPPSGMAAPGGPPGPPGAPPMGAPPPAAPGGPAMPPAPPPGM